MGKPLLSISGARELCVLKAPMFSFSPLWICCVLNAVISLKATNVNITCLSDLFYSNKQYMCLVVCHFIKLRMLRLMLEHSTLS